MKKDLNSLKYKDIAVEESSNKSLLMAVGIILLVVIIAGVAFLDIKFRKDYKKAQKYLNDVNIEAKNKTEIIESPTYKKNLETINAHIKELEDIKSKKMGENLQLDSVSHGINLNYFANLLLYPTEKRIEKLGVKNEREPEYKDITKSTLIEKGEKYVLQSLKAGHDLESLSFITNQYFETKIDGSDVKIISKWFLDGIPEDNNTIPDIDSKTLAWNIYKNYMENILNKAKEGKIDGVTETIPIDSLTWTIERYQYAGNSNKANLGIVINVPISEYNNFIKYFNTVKYDD